MEVGLTIGERIAKFQHLDREVLAAIGRPANVVGCFVHLASEVLSTATAAEVRVF